MFTLVFAPIRAVGKVSRNRTKVAQWNVALLRHRTQLESISRLIIKTLNKTILDWLTAHKERDAPIDSLQKAKWDWAGRSRVEEKSFQRCKRFLVFRFSRFSFACIHFVFNPLTEFTAWGLFSLSAPILIILMTEFAQYSSQVHHLASHFTSKAESLVDSTRSGTRDDTQRVNIAHWEAKKMNRKAWFTSLLSSFFSFNVCFIHARWPGTHTSSKEIRRKLLSLMMLFVCVAAALYGFAFPSSCSPSSRGPMTRAQPSDREKQSWRHETLWKKSFQRRSNLDGNFFRALKF